VIDTAARCPYCYAVCPTVTVPAATAGVRRPPPPPPRTTTSPALALEPDSQVGRIIGDKFQLVKLIGEGGMGKVYRARHLTLDKDVCIKMLRPGLVNNEAVVARFAREAKAVSRLRNAHTIQILDFGQDERGLLYIVMELVAGRNLQQVFAAEAPFSEERVCHIAEQILSALTEAHTQHVIHRDLKPENIMVEQRKSDPDFVTVLDFGIAKIQESGLADITRADMVCGTPAYMSPEQGSGGEVDARSDLYAVGVILYQLVTGVVPFDGASSIEILTKHQVDFPIPPNVRRRDRPISAELEQLILRALEKEPGRRLQTADSFREKVLRIAERLRQQREKTLDVPEVAQPTIAAGAGVAASSPPPLRPAPHPEQQEAEDAQLEETLALRVRAYRQTLLLRGAIVLVVLLGGAFIWFRSTMGREPVPPAPIATSTPPAATSPSPAPMPVPMPGMPAHPAIRVIPNDSSAGPAPARQVHVRPRNPAEAKRLVDEEADPAYYEEKFTEAEKFYRQAIHADWRYAAAYKGLFKAGVGAADKRAIREGGRGYLKLNPEADDAEVIRETLKRF
jgi:serine/threonine protein kinase